MTQKFFKGDLVQVGKMPLSMSHFTGNCKAIVLGTYAEAFDERGGRAEKAYTLNVLKRGDSGESSWYHEDQLTLIGADRFDLLPKGNLHRKVWEAKQRRGENT
jgi:hypothetical protein